MLFIGRLLVKSKRKLIQEQSLDKEETMHRYQHKFTHAFYILPSIFVEWLDKDGKREYTIGIEWLRYGLYLEI